MYQGSRKRRTSAFSLCAANPGSASGSLPGAAGSNRKHGSLELPHLQRGKAARKEQPCPAVEKSIGCGRDSEEVTRYPWAASSLLRRVEEPLLTLGERCFADVEELLLKRLCVYTAFTCKYKYLRVCLDEFRSCSLDTLFKVVIFKILRKTPRCFRVLLCCSNSSSSLHGWGKWETSRGVSLRRCSSVNHNTLGSKY